MYKYIAAMYLYLPAMYNDKIAILLVKGATYVVKVTLYSTVKAMWILLSLKYLVTDAKTFSFPK